MENNNLSIANCIQETEVENLYVIPAGNVPPNPSELLVSEKMVELLDKLKEMCDLVIIDGTPCDLVTDSVILSRIVDSTVIVTEHKQTKKENLKRIVNNIQNVGGKIAGIVINKLDISVKKYNEGYYYYGSISTEKDSKQSKTK
jgi:capsular exopolysaccharide synthesis family protein